MLDDDDGVWLALSSPYRVMSCHVLLSCQSACSPPEVWKLIRCFLPCSQVHLQCCVVLLSVACSSRALLSAAVLAGWLAGSFGFGSGSGAAAPGLASHTLAHGLPRHLSRGASVSISSRRVCLSVSIRLSLV
jgi:hypothetical protein